MLDFKFKGDQTINLSSESTLAGFDLSLAFIALKKLMLGNDGEVFPYK